MHETTNITNLGFCIFYEVFSQEPKEFSNRNFSNLHNWTIHQNSCNMNRKAFLVAEKQVRQNRWKHVGRTTLTSIFWNFGRPVSHQPEGFWPSYCGGCEVWSSCSNRKNMRPSALRVAEKRPCIYVSKSTNAMVGLMSDIGKGVYRCLEERSRRNFFQSTTTVGTANWPSAVRRSLLGTQEPGL